MGTIKDYRNMVEQPWGRMFYDLIYRQLAITNDRRVVFTVTGTYFGKMEKMSQRGLPLNQRTKKESTNDMYPLYWTKPVRRVFLCATVTNLK